MLDSGAEVSPAAGGVLVDAESLGVPALLEPQMQLHVHGGRRGVAQPLTRAVLKFPETVRQRQTRGLVVQISDTRLWPIAALDRP